MNGEEIMGDAVKKIVEEADRIEENCNYSAVQHFIAATYWRHTHLIMGGTATILAAISSIRAFNDLPTGITGTLAAIAAIFAGLMTFLDPKRKADAHHAKGVAQDKIRADARILKNVEALATPSESELTAKLKAISDRKFDADAELPPVPGGWIYKRAKKEIEEGRRTHRIEEAPPDH